MPTAREIEARKTKSGSWTRATLAEWGVPWPPPRGWKQTLVLEDQARQRGERYQRPHGWASQMTFLRADDVRPMR
jgi:hypothetical protein